MTMPAKVLARRQRSFMLIDYTKSPTLILLKELKYQCYWLAMRLCGAFANLKSRWHVVIATTFVIAALFTAVSYLLIPMYSSTCIVKEDQDLNIDIGPFFEFR